MGKVKRVLVDISGEDWSKMDWENFDFSTVDFSKLSTEQKKEFKGISKKMKKIQKEKKKREKEEKKRKLEEEKKKALTREDITWTERFENKKQFGDLPVMDSSFNTKVDLTPLQDIESFIGKEVCLRVRIHNRRDQKDMSFFVFRDGYETIQGVVGASETVSKRMVKYCTLVPRESIVDVHGKIVSVPKPTNTTKCNVEIQIARFYCYSASEVCPLIVEDASQNDELLEKQIEEQNKKAEEEKGKKKNKVLITTGQDIRLDYRYLDLRAPAHKAIFKITSAVGMFFRKFLYSNGFMEIHSPKMIATASEGGADVFKLDYFGKKAFLAQSPQLYKQMAIMCDFEKVFEVGPVFRAENSHTNRHLTEFTGLDLEMRIKDHYHEVLDVLDGLFVSIFEGINKHFQKEMEVIQQQYPFEPITYAKDKKNVRMTYKEGIEMLKKDGADIDEYGDLDTVNEKRLGKLVKEKYGTDFYILDKYPMAVRPFYTMPDHEDPKYSNSYDIFIRGQEVTSGAQRIHDPKLLLEKAKEKEVDLTPIMDYVNSFGYGAWPHGGAGLGLERIVMLFLGLPNVRKCSLFPRDPKRINP